MEERLIVPPIFQRIRSLLQRGNECLDAAVGAIRNQQHEGIAQRAKLEWIERGKGHFRNAFALADADHENRAVLAPEALGGVDIDWVERNPAALGGLIPLDDRQPPRFDLGAQSIREPVTQGVRRLRHRSLDFRIGHDGWNPSFVRWSTRDYSRWPV